ncbi:hypothetical protein [Conexibacter sp. SYSU D00693]|uniref:hypothetical protein n=1 Tax=Conexibacter sp. SYSU D00693 TaxID=2812560 RepID=UPI00196B252F|nr:hypothetical protein [Conexibacter sp. SYSU D00693]
MRRAPAIALGLAALAGALAPSSAAAQAARCSASALPVAVVAPTPAAAAYGKELPLLARSTGRRVTGLTLRLTRRGRTVARGALGRALTTSGGRVRLTVEGALRAGAHRLAVSGRASGCARTVTTTRSLRFSAARRLAVTGVDEGDRTPGAPRQVTVRVRPRAGVPLRLVRATLLDAAGRTVGTGRRDAAITRATPLTLALSRDAGAGTYELVLSARSGKERASRVLRRALVLAAAPPAPLPTPATSLAPTTPVETPTGVTPGVFAQGISLRWSAGTGAGSEQRGFAVPGIGSGEVVCSPRAQYLRVVPSDGSHETSMVLWTHRDWTDWRESALRESTTTLGSSPEFLEGLNKFSAPAWDGSSNGSEKRSHGYMVGVVSDRGPFGGPGEARTPTTIRISWDWDFTTGGAERCSVDLDVHTEGAGGDGPGTLQARSLPVTWRGSATAAGRDAVVRDVPGFGRVAVECRPGPSGSRRLTVVDPAPGLRVDAWTFQGSDTTGVSLVAAPYVLELPTNGLVQGELWIDDGTGRKGDLHELLVASRWKVNDPDPAQNACGLAGQVLRR